MQQLTYVKTQWFRWLRVPALNNPHPAGVRTWQRSAKSKLRQLRVLDLNLRFGGEGRARRKITRAGRQKNGQIPVPRFILVGPPSSLLDFGLSGRLRNMARIGGMPLGVPGPETDSERRIRQDWPYCLCRLFGGPGLVTDAGWAGSARHGVQAGVQTARRTTPPTKPLV